MSHTLSIDSKLMEYAKDVLDLVEVLELLRKRGEFE